MKRLLLILSLVVLSSCVQSSGGVALVVNTTEGIAAYNGVTIEKSGKACVKNFLTIAAIGDGGIEAAKRDGMITNIASVDIEYLNILGIYQHACTIVKGS